MKINKLLGFSQNYFFSGVLYLGETIRTYNHAIRRFFLSALAYGYSGYGLLSKVPQSFTTHRTPRTPSVPMALSIHSGKFDSTIKEHRVSPPSFKWREEPKDHWFYYCDRERTGIWIEKRTSIPICQHRRLVNLMTLKSPFFHIFHSVNDTEYHIGTIDIMDTQSLREAKRLAECYYIEWLRKGARC